MKIEFTMEMDIPSATAQQIGVAIRNGRPHTYKKKKVKEAEAHFAVNLRPHRPHQPVEGATMLSIVWSYHSKVKKRNGEMKITRPDLDNLNKIIQDSLVREGFLKDDAQVAILKSYKVWTDRPENIHIVIQTLEGVRILYDKKVTS